MDKFFLAWHLINFGTLLIIKSADGETIGVVALEYILPQDFRDVDKKLFGNIANLLAFVFDAAHKESK